MAAQSKKEGFVVIPTEVEGSRALCGAQAITSRPTYAICRSRMASVKVPRGGCDRFTFIFSRAAVGGVLYVGVTSDLQRRTYEHKHGLIEGFTRKCGVKRLVYYEHFDDPLTAIEREKQIKRWRRRKKLASPD